MMEKGIEKGSVRPLVLAGEDYLTYDDMSDDRAAEGISTDKIEDVLQKLGGESHSGTEDLLIDEVEAAGCLASWPRRATLRRHFPRRRRQFHT
jgi:hypothetical protein